ncbi:MAG: hypothetical protein ACFCUV_18665 [Rivularia sp. (in: cyanobacteria)]
MCLFGNFCDYSFTNFDGRSCCWRRSIAHMNGVLTFDNQKVVY